MKLTRIRLPKVLLIGILLSFLTMWLASGVLEVLVRYIPISPTAQIYDYLALNHNNPEVYATGYYRNLAPKAGYLDAFVCTPLALLCSGIVFGNYAKRARLGPAATAAGGALLGLVFTIFVIALTWVLVLVGTNLMGQGAPQFASPSLSGRALGLAALELGISASVCAFGAWAARSACGAGATDRASGSRRTSTV